jgi:hypothetical protein
VLSDACFFSFAKHCFLFFLKPVPQYFGTTFCFSWLKWGASYTMILLIPSIIVCRRVIKNLKLRGKWFGILVFLKFFIIIAIFSFHV